MKHSILRVAALGLVVAACGGGATIVATVNGADISLAEVEELSAGDRGSIPAQEFADNLLNTIVEHIVIDTAASDFDITFNDEEIETRRAELEEQIVAGGTTYEEFLDQNGYTNARIARIAHQQLVANAIEEALVAAKGELTETELQERYDAALLDYTEACVSHILVATEEEALTAKERIDGGEAFADVAKDVGTDGTAPNGGDLGCAPLSRYVPEFGVAASEIPLDVTSDPVHSQFGYHLILVTERTTKTFDEARDELQASANTERGGTLVQDWLLEVVTAAEVTIGEEYGTWVTDPFPDVQPPA